MKEVKSFIEEFLKRSGAKVFSAMFLAKIAGFVISIAVANILTQSDFGNFTYAFTVVSFLIPFMGFGSYQSLVYFGAQLKSEEEKKQLFGYAFLRGILFSIVLAVLLILFSGVITQKQPNSQVLLVVLSLHIVTFTLVEFVRNYARLTHRNNVFASSENAYNALLILLVITASWFLNSLGYAWAMALTPLIIGIYYIFKLKLGNFSFKNPLKVKTWDFWKYGLFISLGAVAAKLMYVVDIVTIGNFLEVTADDLTNGISRADYISKQIAIYKICSIIPIASFVLPLAIITTDFVKITENNKNRAFISGYVKSMMKILFPISILGAAVFHFGSDYILLLFGEKYAGNGELISIFSLAVIGAFTFRIPFGNLLSAVGKANWNAYISFTVLALNVILNYYMVKNYGITGAAWATTILIWISGLINFLCYKVYLNNYTA